MRFRIFSLAGDMIYETNINNATSGEKSITWDLLNKSGAKVGPGLYMYELRADTGLKKYRVMKKVVVIK